LFERMGIAAEVKPKIILAPGSGLPTESVAQGNAALVITFRCRYALIRFLAGPKALPTLKTKGLESL
jgi:hypothetical protein